MSWADLPPDLLRLISGRFRKAGDFVRFHSTCQAWRDAAPGTLPEFLPWLLTPGGHDPPSTAQLRSIFSKTTWRCAPGTYSLCSRWLAAESGAGAWMLTMEAGGGPSPSPLRLIDPFTGSATSLPPFAGRTSEAGHIPYDDDFVLDDGSVVMFAIAGFFKYSYFAMVAVLRPGAAAWAEGQAHLFMKHLQFRAAAYYDGGIVFAGLLQVETVRLRGASGGNDGDAALDAIASTRWDYPPWENTDSGPEPRRQRIYTFKSRGELLAACLLLPDTTMEQGGGADPGALVRAMSVSVYALEPAVEDDSGGNPRWVARDSQSLHDRVLFLGCPTSFAVDAARFVGDVGGGGYAYFVLSSRKPGAAVAWRKAPKACHVYRYSFEDGAATVVEELPAGAGWDDAALMTWLAPRPAAIAPVREIRERLLQDRNKQQQGAGAPRPRSTIRAPRTVFGPQFTFFMGNLPPGVGRLDLEQFFAKFGKVTDARVKSNARHGTWGSTLPYTESYATGYWSFGFVTMTPIGEPDDVFGALDGEYFFGHVLRVKFAEDRPEGPFVMPLLAPNKARKQTPPQQQ